MFDYFNGTVASLNPTEVTIDCGGVGYHFHISLFTYTALKEKKQAKIFAHQVVREDALLLFGFWNEDERSVFRDLLSVSGVGASTARIILSSLSYEEVHKVIANGDNLTLQRVKGIGAKTAQRIIIDLQDKMKKTVGILVSPVIGEHNTFKSEALSALLTLGFARLGAEKAIQQAIRNNESPASVEVLIKNALSYL